MLRFCVGGNNNYYLRHCAGRILHLVIVRQRAALHGPIGIWQCTEWSLVSGLGDHDMGGPEPDRRARAAFLLVIRARGVDPPNSYDTNCPSTAPVPFPLSPSPPLRSWTPVKFGQFVNFSYI